MKGFDYKDHWSKLCQQGFPDSQARVSKIGMIPKKSQFLADLEMKFKQSSNIDSKRRCPSTIS